MIGANLLALHLGLSQQEVQIRNVEETCLRCRRERIGEDEGQKRLTFRYRATVVDGCHNVGWLSGSILLYRNEEKPEHWRSLGRVRKGLEWKSALRWSPSATSRPRLL